MRVLQYFLKIKSCDIQRRLIWTNLSMVPLLEEFNGGQNYAALLLKPNTVGLVDEGRVEDVKPGEVLIKMTHMMVSRQDIELSTMENFKGIQFSRGSHVLGSMGSGKVAAIGPEVYSNLKLGDRVVVEPVIFCGQCVACSRKLYDSCKHLEVTGTPPRNGLIKNYYSHPWKLVHKLPPGVSAVDGLYISSIAKSLHIYNVSKANENSNVVILGLGTEGACAVKVFSSFGVKSLVAIDKVKYKLEVAKRLGAMKVVNTVTEFPPVELITDIVEHCHGGEKTDILIDTRLSPATANLTVALIKDAGKVILQGIPTLEKKFNYINFVTNSDKELHIKEVFGYGDQFQNAIDYLDGEFISYDIQPLVFPLSDLLKCLSVARSGLAPHLATVIIND